MTEEIAPESGAEKSKANQEVASQSSAQPSDSAETPEAATEAALPPPPPEPLTPERAAAENWRNDLFIMAAVLVIAFLLGSFKIADSNLWIHLKSGWQIDQQGVPDRDSFAYTTADQKWVNSNWLYDWGLYQIEVIESRMRARRLVNEYQQLLSNTQQPQLDSQGREIGKRLPNETVQELEASFSRLADAAKTTDTHQMRVAAEQTADLVKQAGLVRPQALYPALAAYNTPTGYALIQLSPAVVIKSIVLVALAAMLLCVRHPGPTSWWTAAVTVVALVGMSDRFTLSPSVFSLIGVAVVLWILHAYQTGRTWAAWLLIPLEVLWVNVDTAFALGFVLVAIVLVCQIVGRAAGRSTEREKEVRPTSLAASFVIALVFATVANRFGLSVWSEPYEWTQFVLGRATYVAATAVSMFGGTGPWIKVAQSSGNEILSISPDLFAPVGRVYKGLLGSFELAPMAAVLIIVASFISFGLNRKRFRVSRLLVLLLCVGMFVFAERYVGIAVLVAAVVLALNGQEWYLDKFGTDTRITAGWWFWSQGGRAATLLGIVAIAIALITGWFTPISGGDFGYGIHWVMFDFEPGKLLRQANLKGRVFNTVPVQGNLLVWSNYPDTQVYVDGRETLHQEHLKEFESVKIALRDDDVDVWPEVLDRYGVSHIILNITPIADSVAFPKTFSRLSRDSKWRLVQLSSNSAVFGRVDLPEGHPLAEDAAWVAKNDFDPARLVFTQDGDPLPEPPGPVTPPDWLDVIWRRRVRVFSPQSIAADHYLTSAMMKGPQSAAEAASMGPVFVVPTANCFLAIRDARRGLAKEPRVSSHSYSVLGKAYFYLYNTELMLVPIREIHDMRMYQVVTALNQWVAANPNDLFAQLHLMLRYRTLRYIDLADRHMDALLKLMPDAATIDDFLFDGGQRFSLDKEKLREESRKIKDELARVEYDMEQASAQLTNPVTKANYLAMRGCPARAIELLKEAAAFGVPMDLSPLLAQLYLRIGQPGDTQRGADQQMSNIQQAGGMRPGEKEELWALIKLMQGDYDRARGYMEAAIAETRINLTKETLMAMTADLRNGTIIHAAFSPIDSVETVDRLVRMEHHLGLIHLEAGEPSEAAKHFKQSLAIRDDNVYRPISGFYLEKITGEKLEPLPDRPEDEESEMSEDAAPVRPAEVPPKPDND